MATVRKAGEIWRCDICGNVVKVIEAGGGQLICCGGPMIRVDGSKTRSVRTAGNR